jgi:CDP-4-dehydro-6-deoxyglucose reductase
VLAAALRQGVSLTYSCRNGSCGTCQGRVLEGQVDAGQYEDKALSAAERAAGQVLFCQALPRSDLVVEAQELTATQGIPIRILPCRVAQMERAAPDVMILRLKLAQNERLQFLAGQYLDILLSGGKRRSFSLANAPHDVQGRTNAAGDMTPGKEEVAQRREQLPRMSGAAADEFLELHIRHVPNGLFSGHVFTAMKEKDLLRIQGPLGTFFLREESQRPIILVAGGTGFAPIKSLVEHAFARGITRPLHFYWGVRARVDLYHHALVESWAQAHPNFRYTPVLSEAKPEDQWSGRGGFVHEAVATDHADLQAYDVYASGPPLMIAALKRVLAERGLPAERFFYDSFESAPNR